MHLRAAIPYIVTNRASFYRSLATGIYIFTRETLTTHHHRIGQRPALFVMADAESQDIDTEFEFHMAEVMASLLPAREDLKVPPPTLR